jgi:hypothetical protein
VKFRNSDLDSEDHQKAPEICASTCSPRQFSKSIPVVRKMEHGFMAIDFNVLLDPMASTTLGSFRERCSGKKKAKRFS